MNLKILKMILKIHSKFQKFWPAKKYVEYFQWKKHYAVACSPKKGWCLREDLEDLAPGDTLAICEVANASLNDEDRFHGPMSPIEQLLGDSLGYQQPRKRGKNNGATASEKTFYSNGLFPSTGSISLYLV
jgi:hypothetical protein